MLYGFSSLFVVVFSTFPLFRSENLYHFELMLKVRKIQEESGLERGGGFVLFFNGHSIMTVIQYIYEAGTSRRQ